MNETQTAAVHPLEEMGISREVVQAFDWMGFQNLTAIQQKCIPLMMDGHDIIAIAPTGTGKTLGFGIPMLEYVNLDDSNIQEVVLAPTRELAQQIADELTHLAHFIKGLKIAVIYGGQPFGKQMSALSRKPQVLVATPGRLLDHMQRGNIRLGTVHTMVLDEADEMLKMGFVQDVEKIIESADPNRQLVMFSATTNQDVLTVSWKYQHDPIEIVVQAEAENKPNITQYIIESDQKQKYEHLLYLLDSDQYKRVMIFCNTKDMTARLCDRLKKAGYQAECLHGDVRQSFRDKVMSGFRKGEFEILVATDVAARGIDVDDVEAVINYDIPQDIEYYVHRIGRTGRAGRKGRSFTFANSREIGKIREIERVCHTTITEKKLPGAAKVLKAKADKYLNKAWELHEHEDVELMKSFLQRKMEEEGCDALELAAAMLKLQVGDKGEEIAVDDYVQRRGRFGEKGRFGRNDGEGRGFGRGDGRRRFSREDGDRRRFGRGDRDRRDDDNTVSGENRRHRRDENREDGRKWGGRDKKAADRKYSGDRAEREVKKRKKREEPGIGNSFPKRKKS